MTQSQHSDSFETRLAQRLPELRAGYERHQAKGLKLDLTRGKPSPAQLELSADLLQLPGQVPSITEDGLDIRNYGGAEGLIELRRIFAELYGIPVGQLLALANASLQLMHDTLMFAYVYGLPGGQRPWGKEAKIKFICPVPGYDRHFAITEALGMELIPVPMNDDGPDADLIATLVADDPAIKGMWIVPTYSNPSGATTSLEVARKLVSMPTAAPDFRIFWDDAYALHPLTEHPPQALPILELAAESGNPDRVFFFASTSKITFAGSGVAFFAASQANLDWLKKRMSVQTIGPDKVNQLRHALHLKNADGVRAHMAKHRSILAPKFEAMDRVLTHKLGDWPEVATWSKPEGGYFISLDVLPGTAARVVELAKGAGVALTPAGSTWPYGKDPHDSNIRLAPSMATVDQVEAAAEILATCVLLAAAE